MLSFDKIIAEYNKLNDAKKKNFNRILFRQRGHFIELLKMIELIHKDEEITEKSALINMLNIPGYEGMLPSDLPFITIKKSTSTFVFNTYAMKLMNIEHLSKVEFLRDDDSLFVFKSDSIDGFTLNLYSRTSSTEQLVISNISLVNYINESLGINTKTATYRMYLDENPITINNRECYKIQKILKSSLKTAFIK